MEYIKNPKKIEMGSFDIISGIIKDEYPDYKFKSFMEEMIIKRAIHTTADFDYLNILKISDGAVEKISNAIKDGAIIYTDTTMIKSGINKRKLSSFGSEVVCLVSDERTFELAEKKGITRSMAAVEIALEDKRKKIFVFGNAPTALFRLMELDPKGEKFEAVIGVPVGFVGAAESKVELEKTDLAYILSSGRKGGSNLAAAIINAFLYNIGNVE